MRGQCSRGSRRRSRCREFLQAQRRWRRRLRRRRAAMVGLAVLLAFWRLVHARFGDAAGYTMVKKNWFNGVPMPSIRVRRLDGTLDTVRAFSYKDYLSSLS